MEATLKGTHKRANRELDRGTGSVVIYELRNTISEL